MHVTFRWRRAIVATAVSLATLPALHAADAVTPAVSPPTTPVATPVATAAEAAPAAVVNSPLDAPLFYQLLIGEMELRAGEPGTAFEVVLDAARRTGDGALYRRAVDIALQARAGDMALAATQTWRKAIPDSMDALRLQLQILAALNKLGEAAEPLRTLLRLTPEAERPALIAALPRFLQRANDRAQTAALLEEVLTPYLANKATAVPARVALGRGWLAAGSSERALALAVQAQNDDPAAPGPVLLAMELMASQPAAEALVTAHLQQPKVDPAMRLAYVRVLTGSQRYADAVRQLEVITREQPDLAPPFLSLGALHLELKQSKQGEAALLRYVALVQAQAPAAANAPAGGAAATDGDDEEEDGTSPAEQGLVQAWLMLAQAAEQRSDYKAAESWLARIDDPKRALEVQSRRASLLARQGKLAEARALIQGAPESEPGDARAKLIAEAGLLRDVKRWQDAYDVLGAANQRFADDSDLLYEQAMMAEKLNRLDDMERLLRRVIALKPESAHAHNALGYSLADRSQRLPEARALIQRALELSPGDPFITDSLGWAEFRLGNADEALRLLRKAYAARPDPEIAAHLGEVLWTTGKRDEARRVWREAKSRDAANDVLRETLTRLKAEL
jgi:tetratricopeptide (TPR) repeat protein